MDFKVSVANEIMKAIGAVYGDAAITAPEIAAVLEIPPDTAMGDYAFPCFKLSKVLRKSPMMIADALAGAIEADFLSKAESVKGYLNFFIDKATYAEKVITSALAAGERYGSDDSGSGKTVVLDYSSINIAKRFHIGHLSTTMIGNSLYRLHKFFGWNAVGVNHLGDWGTQFGKMIAAYKRWGDKDAVEAGGVQAMVDLYVRFNREAETDEALADEGRLWFKKMEDGDEEALSIFRWFKEVTLADAKRVYGMLGVEFDSYAGESFYNDKMDPVVAELREKGLLRRAAARRWSIWTPTACRRRSSCAPTGRRSTSPGTLRRPTTGMKPIILTSAFMWSLISRTCISASSSRSWSSWATAGPRGWNMSPSAWSASAGTRFRPARARSSTWTIS